MQYPGKFGLRSTKYINLSLGLRGDLSFPYWAMNPIIR